VTDGAFALVLLCHAPLYAVGDTQTRPDDPLLTYTAESLVPILRKLFALREEGVPFQVTLAVSPLLAHQLNAESFSTRFNAYLEARMAAAQRDIRYYNGESVDWHPHSALYARNAAPLNHAARREADEHQRYLAQWNHDRLAEVKQIFNETCGANLIGALRDLQDSAHVELMTTAATYAYLPLLASDAAVHAQIHGAVTLHERLFGRKPQAFYLPALAYRPSMQYADGSTRASLAATLQAHGFKVFIAETHLIRGGALACRPEGKLRDIQGGIAQRYTFTQANTPPARDASPLKPHAVQEHDGQTLNIAVLASEERTLIQVSGKLLGYPRDFDYLDPAYRSAMSGLPYWRVTVQSADFVDKDLYHPDWAAYKINQHAEHFAHLVGDILRSQHDGGIVTTVLDSSMLGAQWYEGTAWLMQTLRLLSHQPHITLTTPSAYVAQNPPQSAIPLAEGSSGIGGTHIAWANDQTAWVWDALRNAEHTMQRLATQHRATAGDDTRYVLNQAARELMLAQCSDWTLMMTANQDAAYAAQRVASHLNNFNRLVQSVENGQPDVRLAQGSFRYNNVLQEIEFTGFAR